MAITLKVWKTSWKQRNRTPVWVQLSDFVLQNPVTTYTSWGEIAEWSVAFPTFEYRPSLFAYFFGDEKSKRNQTIFWVVPYNGKLPPILGQGPKLKTAPKGAVSHIVFFAYCFCGANAFWMIDGYTVPNSFKHQSLNRWISSESDIHLIALDNSFWNKSGSKLTRTRIFFVSSNIGFCLKFHLI